MKKRLKICRCWVIMFVCFVLGICWSDDTPQCEAAAVVAKGDLGGVFWELDTDGVLSFDGQGTFTSYIGPEQVPWHVYRAGIKKVIFRMERVAGGDISGYFADCSNLQSVNNIPEGIERMDETFSGCKNLISVGRIPESMQSLCRGFKDCIRLDQEINIPGQATGVKGAFDGCLALTCTPDIEGDKITDMSEMFRSTAIETGPDIPEGVEDLSYTFAGCRSLRTAPRLVSSVVCMDHTFYGCSRMTNGTDVPVNVKTMSYCFYGCTGLTAAPAINSNIVQDMEYAFYNCGSMQTSPKVPESVRNMSYTFYNCGSMQNAPDIGPNVKKMAGCFAKCGKVSGTMTVYAVIKNKADYEKFAGDTAKYLPRDNPDFIGGAGSGLKVNYIDNNKSMILKYLSEGWNNGGLQNNGSIGSLRLGAMASQNVISCQITKPEDVVYNGTPFTPEPDVYYAGIRLEKDKDYMLSYGSNEKAGMAKVTIWGLGEYEGNASVYFVIQKAKFKLVRAYDYSGIYDGKAHSVMIVCDDGAKIEYGVQEGQYMSEESPSYTLPGVYDVYFRIRKPNYETYTGRSTVTIESAKLNVDSAGFSGEYDGNPHSIRVCADEGAVIRYGISPGEYDMMVSPSYINAGKYTVYYEVSKIGHATFKGKQQVIIKKKKMGVLEFPDASGIMEGDGLMKASLAYHSNKYGTFSWKDPGMFPEKSGFYPLMFVPLDTVNYDYEGVIGYQKPEGVIIRNVWVDVNPDRIYIQLPDGVVSGGEFLSENPGDQIDPAELLASVDMSSGDSRQSTIASFIKDLGGKKKLSTIKAKAPERPGKTEIKKLRFGKGKIKVVWKKNKKATGYQIVCSRKKSGKGSTKQKYTKNKSIRIQWRKTGKCYVKVRAYTVYKGKKVYGAWSRIHSLNINKKVVH